MLVMKGESLPSDGFCFWRERVGCFRGRAGLGERGCGSGNGSSG